MPPRTGKEFLETHEQALLEPQFVEHRDMEADAFIAARLGWMDPNWPEYPRDRARLVEQIADRRRRIREWEDELLGHSTHPTLRCYESAVTRQFGFRCDCHGAVYDRTVGLSQLRLSPRARELVALTRRMDAPPNLVRREQALMARGRVLFSRAAMARARALLHQLLTREQRWSLRASKSFRVVGQDGRVYEITENERVKLIEKGKATVSYCIHPLQTLPPYDVMLGQKLLLETNIEHFLATAIARDLRPLAIQFDEALDVAMAAGAAA